MSKMNLPLSIHVEKKRKLRILYARDDNFDYARLLTLVKDETNVNFYRRIFEGNKHLFKDKVVLDVGCGCGLLSLFAVQAGAAKVYAIEGSSLTYYLEKIFRRNNASHKITLIDSEVEEAELPENTKVDVIFSGWMSHVGFYKLFYEPVIFARDKWLKPDGIVIPDIISLYVVGVRDPENYEERIECYQKIAGLKFGCLRKAALNTAYNLAFDDTKIITTKYLINCVDMHTASRWDVEHTKKFFLSALKTDFMHGIVLFFNVEFTKGLNREKVSSSPDAEKNCWTPHLFYLNEPLVLRKNEIIRGSVSIEFSIDMIKMVKIHVQFIGSHHIHSETKEFAFMD